MIVYYFSFFKNSVFLLTNNEDLFYIFFKVCLCMTQYYFLTGKILNKKTKSLKTNFENMIF